MRIVDIRNTFNMYISGSPIRNIEVFFQGFSRMMYAMKVANIKKPIKLYTPEHATSTEKGIIVPFARVIVIKGVPNWLPNVEGIPMVLTIA